jgi:hypothetical protein
VSTFKKNGRIVLGVKIALEPDIDESVENEKALSGKLRAYRFMLLR